MSKVCDGSVTREVTENEAVYRGVSPEGKDIFVLVRKDEYPVEPFKEWKHPGVLSMFEGKHWAALEAEAASNTAITLSIGKDNAPVWRQVRAPYSTVDYQPEGKRYYLCEKIFELIKNDPVSLSMLMTNIERGDYDNVVSRGTENAEVEYDKSMARHRKEYSKVIACFDGSSKYIAQFMYTSMNDFDAWSLEPVLESLTYTECIEFLSKRAPNLLFIPIGYEERRNYNKFIYISRCWEQCEGFWLFDMDKPFCDPFMVEGKEYKRYEHAATGLKHIVEKALEGENLYFNGEVYSISICNAYDVKEDLIQEASVLPKKYPVSFNQYEAYSSAVLNAQSEESFNNYYGIGAVKDTLKARQINCVEQVAVKED